jgi:para-nitrobenzyl esterase
MSVVTTASGQVRGAETADGVLSWRGIPYAAPPAGDLRLRPPQPPGAWSGVRDALGYGNRAPQAPLAGLLLGPPPPPVSEDCLYLNVTAPAGATGRPVLLWIHGGGFEMGHGPDQAGDGAAFARSRRLVVVTFNYRLGALGFLDVPGERPTGALGLHDQLAALRWTRENIAAFGGDPAQITVYGLSAGGKSVTHLLASPLARGMIARAAESSGGDHVKDPAQARDLAARFFQALGAAPERIRDVPAGDILAAQQALAAPPRSTWIWRPSVDGAALTEAPLAAIAGGAAAGIPLLLQTCARETALYQLLGPDAADQAEPVLAGYFGPARAAELLEDYAARYPDLGQAELRGVRVMTDERYVVRTERLADAQAAHGPVWRSRYDGPYTGAGDDPDPAFAQYADLLAGGHGADGAGIWLGGDGLSGALHEAWGAFAASGDPGWARYGPGDRDTMIFEPGGPRPARDPFAFPRQAWAGLDWQPGTWWPAAVNRLHRLGQQRDRAEPLVGAGCLVDGDELVGACLLDQAVEVVPDLTRGADRGVAEHVVHVPAGAAGQQLVGLPVGDLGRVEPDLAGEQADRPGPADRLELRPGLLGGAGGGHVDPDDRVGRLELLRRLELGPVGGERVLELVGREVRGERVRQPVGAGQLRAEQRRAQDVERDLRPGAGDGGHARYLAVAGQVGLQLADVLRERLGRLRVAAQRVGSVPVGAGGPAEPEVDAARVHRLEGAELLRDHQRGMVGQHDPAGTEPDRRRVRADVRDQHAGGGRRDGRHVVMLGVPDALVAEFLGALRERDARGEAVTRGLAAGDRRQVENRQAGFHRQ